MNIKDTANYRPDPPTITISDALYALADPYTDSNGALENLSAEVTCLRELVLKFMEANITSIDQLNDLAGYERFEEVPE